MNNQQLDPCLLTTFSIRDLTHSHGHKYNYLYIYIVRVCYVTGTMTRLTDYTEPQSTQLVVIKSLKTSWSKW